MKEKSIKPPFLSYGKWTLNSKIAPTRLRKSACLMREPKKRFITSMFACMCALCSLVRVNVGVLSRQCCSHDRLWEGVKI